MFQIVFYIQQTMSTSTTIPAALKKKENILKSKLFELNANNVKQRQTTFKQWYEYENKSVNSKNTALHIDWWSRWNDINIIYAHIHKSSEKPFVFHNLRKVLSFCKCKKCDLNCSFSTSAGKRQALIGLPIELKLPLEKQIRAFWLQLNGILKCIVNFSFFNLENLFVKKQRKFKCWKCLAEYKNKRNRQNH